MHMVADQPSSDRHGRRLSRRAAILSLVVALHIAVMLIVLRPVAVPHVPSGPQSISVTLLPAPEPARPAEQRREAARAPATAPAEKPAVVAPPVEPDIWSQVIPLTREQYAAADIGKKAPRVPSPESESNSAVPTAAVDDAAEQLGGGPAGEQLYQAEWYREPTQAELATYMPAGAPRNGWGMIACQTVDNFRVDDCRPVAQYPPGSGLAYAVLQAAWQFRVRPPRSGGRLLVGAWVRIRIDYSEAARN